MSEINIIWGEKVSLAFRQKRETNEVDFKLDLSTDGERLKEHINAFGNSISGGVFVFGVTPKYEVVNKGLNHEAIIKKINEIARNSQEPPLHAEVIPIKLEDQDLLGILIYPSSRQPVFIKDRSPWGGESCFKRSASSTVALSNQEIRDLLMRSRDFSSDEEPVEGAQVEDLDFKLLETIVPPFKAKDGLSPGNIQVLIDNRIICLNNQKQSPTSAGWILFSNNPQKVRSFNNCSIEFQQFRGTARDEPIKKLEITGTLPQQVELAISTIQQHIWTVPKMQGIRREDVPAYDLVTLREVVTNSVVHRDYTQLHQPVKIALFSDRLEIENPGGLMPGLTPLNLIHKRAWRNRCIAQLMGKFGLGEMDGQGIDRIYLNTLKIKVPGPRIIDDKRTFKIVLSAPKEFEDYTPEEKKITSVILLINETEIDNESLRNAFGIDITKASTLLKLLVSDEVIKRTTASMKYAKYRLTDNWQQKIYE